MWRRLRWESLARSFCCCVISSHRSNSFGPNFSRGRRYTCGRVSRGGMDFGFCSQAFVGRDLFSGPVPDGFVGVEVWTVGR